MAQLGADVEQLDQLAKTMDATSQRLAGAAQSTSASVASVQWLGPDADEFRVWWRRSGAVQLTGAADWLRELGATLRQQATQQRRTSEEASLVAGRRGGGGGGGGGGGWSGDPSLVNGADHYQDFPPDDYGPFGPEGTGTPALTDIDQGDLGDCWFLASLGAISQSDPGWITRHIRDNGDGTHTVTLYDRTGDGEYEPVEITVDGDFPVDADGDPVYSQPAAGNETWAMLYEKAFAQWKGG
ncbi:MAG: C2 family cysteine protease, partial [Ilumatobacteraceae bacterium]